MCITSQCMHVLYQPCAPPECTRLHPYARARGAGALHGALHIRGAFHYMVHCIYVVQLHYMVHYIYVVQLHYMVHYIYVVQAHERSLNTDVLFGILKKVSRK